MDYKTYYIEGFSLTIYFRTFNEKRVNEILNTLKGKDYNQVEMSNEDYLNFIYCIIFAKKHYAKDAIEKLVNLFISIEKINSSHQLDIHLALKMMIKYHFDDDNKVRELLTMITKAVHESKMDEVCPYEVEQKSINELRGETSILKTELEQVKSELSQKDSEISQRDSVISQKDSEISQLKEKIRRLEKL